MSHLKEREEKICLNCNTALYGRYCHVCGQENVEPKETVWHLINHFFQDITHFDGKFFSTVKLLLTKPGFLSKEYMIGRRASYLNPIRMYVFTSAFFFLVFFSLKSSKEFVKMNENANGTTAEKKQNLKSWEQQLQATELKLKTGKHDDSIRLKDKIKELTELITAVKTVYGDTTTREFSTKDIALLMLRVNTDSLKKNGMPQYALDSLKHYFERRDTAKNYNADLFGITVEEYPTVEAYDSIQAKRSSGRDGWLKRIFVRKVIEIRNEMNRDEKNFFEQFRERLMHSFPKILFISLPFFALILKLIYIRGKQYYYTSHGIFSIHLYCAVFILFLAVILLNQLQEILLWKWLQAVFGIISFAIWLYVFFYLYKAMRNFYGQGRFKTIMKFLIINLLALILDTVLLAIFVLLSAISF